MTGGVLLAGTLMLCQGVVTALADIAALAAYREPDPASAAVPR